MRPPLPYLISLFISSLFCIPQVLAQAAPATAQAPLVAPTQTKKWTGDLDALLQRRVIRVAVPYSKTFYYTVKGVDQPEFLYQWT